jgi:hypothetical protein
MSKPNPHRLTREQMNRKIDDGESVMLPDGRIIDRKADLPGDADLALMAGDTAAAAIAEDDLEERIAQDRARLDVLKKRRQDQEAAAAAPAPTPAPDDDERRRAEERAALLGTPAHAPAHPAAPTHAAAPARPEDPGTSPGKAKPK